MSCSEPNQIEIFKISFFKRVRNSNDRFDTFAHERVTALMFSYLLMVSNAHHRNNAISSTLCVLSSTKNDATKIKFFLVANIPRKVQSIPRPETEQQKCLLTHWLILVAWWIRRRSPKPKTAGSSPVEDTVTSLTAQWFDSTFCALDFELISVFSKLCVSQVRETYRERRSDMNVGLLRYCS